MRSGDGTGPFQNLIFKGYAFGVVFLEPCHRSVCGGEDLNVLGVANLLACVEVDLDCFHEASRPIRQHAEVKI